MFVSCFFMCFDFVLNLPFGGKVSKKVNRNKEVLLMHKKQKFKKEQDLRNGCQEKTATDNQWTSLTNAQECIKGEEKTATNNQWVSTNKNVK